jgi:hypothetical protein
MKTYFDRERAQIRCGSEFETGNYNVNWRKNEIVVTRFGRIFVYKLSQRETQNGYSMRLIK